MRKKLDMKTDLTFTQAQCQGELIYELEQVYKKLSKTYPGVWGTPTLIGMAKMVKDLRKFGERSIYPNWTLYWQPPLLIEEVEERPGQWCSVCGTAYTFMQSGICVGCDPNPTTPNERLT